MANVDPGELAKFASRAARMVGSARRVPHAARHQRRCASITSRRALRLQVARVLDVGCGGGLLAEGLAARGARVVAIDLAPENIERRP